MNDPDSGILAPERNSWRRLAKGAMLLLAGLALAGLLPWFAGLIAGIAFGALYLSDRELNTRKRRAAAARIERPPAEGRLQAVLDAVPAPMILIDARGMIVHANADARAAFSGLRQGHPATASIRAPIMMEAIETVLRSANEAACAIEERVPVERHFDVVVRRLNRALPDAPSAGIAFAVIFMTETSAARRLEAMRADFIANASHEMRTPLASILGFIETLQGPAKNDVDARIRFLGIMETQARRMARLIDDLLSLSKIELKEHIPPSTPIEMSMLIRSVGNVLAGLAEERKVDLRLAIPDGRHVVPGDRDELVRVFENLIENAIKYGQSGGAVDVTLEAIDDRAIGPAIAVSVRDYGPGIAAEHLPRLTERFYRADVSESRVLGGTGLGLAIVKHIVTRHRGRLGIASEVGKGATFTVTLPAIQG